MPKSRRLAVAEVQVRPERMAGSGQAASKCVRILDFPHAVEHLTGAAQPVLGPDTVELKTWRDHQAHTLKHAVDGAHQLLGALAGLPVQQASDPSPAADKRDRTMTYFTQRLTRLRYAEFQASVYPTAAAVPKAPTSWLSKCV